MLSPHHTALLSQVVISGKRGAADTEALVEAAFRPFAPGKPAVVCVQPRA